MKNSTSSYEVGQTLGGYAVVRKESLEHLDGTYYELTHQKTGARHIHIAAPDDNNTFVVLLPTVPQDSTGVAHILEHVALSGSERFNLRDPFFSMLPRSLKTFMNAMTSSSSTFYPFSTRNTKDFFNLLSVYLDAVFFPRIDEEAFNQEGHRLEFEIPDDPDSGLRFKGVVFNEMKGAMASAGSIMGKAIGQALFPGLTYENNSGGDPQAIPDLTWEQLKNFHAKHYHPSNAYFFTYGNLPLESVLEEIERRALSRFEKTSVDVDIPDVRRFSAPVEFQTVYPLSQKEDPTKKSQVLTAWVTSHIGDSFEVLSLEVLSQVLLSNSSSPLRNALITSGLGDALADGTGFSKSTREAVFGAGLKGINPEDADKVEQLVFQTLQKLVDDGLDQEQVDAAIHQLEISDREVSNAGWPYSLRTFFAISGAYVFGGDPYSSLQFDKDIARLQKERESGGYFENLILKHLLNNNHRARILLTPDQDKDEKDKQVELERLAQIEKALTDEDKKRIVTRAESLKQRQERKQDLSVLPTLELADVPMEFEDVPHTIEQLGGATIGWFPQPTNGLTYVNFAADFSGLDERLKDLLPLFSFALTRVGAAADDYMKVAKRMASYTGGIGAHPSVRALAGEHDAFNSAFSIGGKALARNHAPFLGLLKDIISDAKFEPQSLKELIAQQKAQREASIAHAGMTYAGLIAASKLKAVSKIQERLSGIPQIVLMRELGILAAEDLDALIADFNLIRGQIFRASKLKICVTSEEKNFSEIKSLLEDVLGALDPALAPQAKPQTPELTFKHEARTTSTPVNYNVKVHPAVTFTHPDAPALKVLGHLMKSTYLHREIREKGGAYGSNSSLSSETGLFTFSSYRDPHIARTFGTFESAAKDALAGTIDPENLKEAILTSCGEIDPLESPDTKGYRRFFDDLAGYTIGLKSKFKQGILEVTDADIRRVAETYINKDGAVLAVVGNPEQVEEANKQMGGIFEVSAI